MKGTEAQPVEHVKLRKGFSCTNHIKKVTEIFVCREYRLLLVLTFVLQQAFSSFETNAALPATIDQGVASFHVRTFASCRM